MVGRQSGKTQPEFLTTWFEEYTRPVWNEHLLQQQLSVDVYLEIGVAEGHSMRYIMEHFAPDKAYAIDPYVAPRRRRQNQRSFDTYCRNARHNLRQWKKQIEWVQDTSVDVLRSSLIPDASVDLAYVDGDHNAYMTITDAVLAWWKTKVDGILILDDYNRRWQRGRPWSHEAIDGFLEAFEKRYQILWGGPKWNQTRQIAVRKIRPDR